MQRQKFTFSTTTTPQTLTGANFSGEIRQLGWNPVTTDTGDEIAVFLCPNAGDTSGGFPIYAKDGLGTAFLNALVGNPVHKNASDTGVPGADVSFVGAGDHLMARVTPSGAALAGTLYVWIDDGC